MNFLARYFRDRKAERILRDLQRETEANETTARLWGDQHPFHSTVISGEGQSRS